MTVPTRALNSQLVKNSNASIKDPKVFQSLSGLNI